MSSQEPRPNPLASFGGVFVCAATCGSMQTTEGELPEGWTFLGNYGEVVCSDACSTKRKRFHAQRQDPSWQPPDPAAVAETREGLDQIDQKDMGVTNVADVVRAAVTHISTSAERWLDKQLEKIGEEKKP